MYSREDTSPRAKFLGNIVKIVLHLYASQSEEEERSVLVLYHNLFIICCQRRY